MVNTGSGNFFLKYFSKQLSNTANHTTTALLMT